MTPDPAERLINLQQRMIAGTFGGRSRVASPLDAELPRAVPAAAPPPACPTFVAELADMYEYPIELSTDGALIYSVHQDGGSGEYVRSWDWPALTHVADSGGTGEAGIFGIAADPSGNLAIACGTSGTTRVVDGAGATLYAPTAGYGTYVRRRCDTPTHAVVLTSHVSSGTRRVELLDLNIATGATTTLLADQDLDAVGETGSVNQHVTTPDGAVWFTFNLNGLHPARIYRWASGTGLQRVPDVGRDGVTPFTVWPGPGSVNGCQLLARPDSSVWCHFSQYSPPGGVEVGKSVAPDLTVTDEPCMDAFYGGGAPFAGVEGQPRLSYTANVPDATKAAIEPFNGAFDYLWRMG